MRFILDTMLFRSIILAIVVKACMTEEECSDATLQEIQANFSDCAVKQEFDFEERKANEEGTLEVAGCDLVTRTLTYCSAELKKCYTRQEMQRMKDMHMESMLAQHNHISFASCDIVKEYLESGRREENVVEGAKCGDRKSIHGQQRFQTCSHLHSTEAYEKIQVLEETNSIRETLCNTLVKIASNCSKELEECFSEEEILRTTEENLAEMQRFLANFAVGKINSEDLSGCGVEELNKRNRDFPSISKTEKTTKQELNAKIQESNEISTEKVLNLKQVITPAKRPTEAEQNIKKLVNRASFAQVSIYCILWSLICCIR